MKLFLNTSTSFIIQGIHGPTKNWDTKILILNFTRAEVKVRANQKKWNPFWSSFLRSSIFTFISEIILLHNEIPHEIFIVYVKDHVRICCYLCHCCSSICLVFVNKFKFDFDFEAIWPEISHTHIKNDRIAVLSR